MEKNFLPKTIRQEAPQEAAEVDKTEQDAAFSSERTRFSSSSPDTSFSTSRSPKLLPPPSNFSPKTTLSSFASSHFLFQPSTSSNAVEPSISTHSLAGPHIKEEAGEPFSPTFAQAPPSTSAPNVTDAIQEVRNKSGLQFTAYSSSRR